MMFVLTDIWGILNCQVRRYDVKLHL